VGYTYPRILQSDIAALTVDPAIIAAAAMAGRSPAFQAWLSAPAMGTVQIPVFTGTKPVNTETFSQELRIETDRENRLRGSIGFFYFKNEYDNRAGLAFGGDNLAPGETFRDPLGFGFNFAAAISNDPRNSVVEATNLARTDYQRAYFGSFEYDFFDNLTFGGELRKDKEDRRQFSRAAPTTSRQQRDFDYNTWRYHLDYGLSNTQKFYFSVAKGVISGHFNATFDTLARVPVPIELQGYNPAENRTHEIGWKAEWLDRRLSTEIALFHIKYSGLQVNATPPPPLINAIIQNIGKATSKGIEASVNWAITNKWRVGGTLTLSPTEFGQNAFDPSMTRYCAGGATVALQQANLLRGFCPTTTFRGLLQPNVGGLSLPRAPESTGSLYVALNTPLAGEWSLNARVDGGYQSKAWGISSNLAWIPSRTLINARVGVKRGENLEIALWGRNITDEDYVSAVIFQPSFADGVTYPNVSQGEGSMFGLTASYRFGEGR
jgi:outer membrane receptor protein involved in Fe transport